MRSASERSCEAPIWTVKLPRSFGGGVSATGVEDATLTGGGGAGTTVAACAGGTTIGARPCASCFSGGGGGVSLIVSGSGSGGGGAGFTGAGVGFCATAGASSAARSPDAVCGTGAVRRPTSRPMVNTPPSSRRAETPSAHACLPSRENSIFSRSRSTSRIVRGNTIGSRGYATSSSSGASIRSGAETPSTPSALASVCFRAQTR